MRDPFTWSIPFGRLFGIRIQVHVLFPVVVLGLLLYKSMGRQYEGAPPLPPGSWIDMGLILLLLFLSVLAHELGHCFAARRLDGDADEILLWPLGGLANVDIPRTPRAHFLTAAAGPAVNILLCLLCGLLLAFSQHPSVQPPWNPLYYPSRDVRGLLTLHAWNGTVLEAAPYSTAALLVRLFWVNYFLAFINLVLVGFPLDMGRMFQSVVWHYTSYRQGTLAAVVAGFITTFVVFVAAIVFNDLLTLCLALFIVNYCRHEWIVLETGGDEGLFGYDFSQGYSSLEPDPPPAAPPRRRASWWKRWLQHRAARKIQREQEQREAEERRMDELLEKLHRQGQQALTDEERRFMKRVSDRYRNRN